MNAAPAENSFDNQEKQKVEKDIKDKEGASKLLSRVELQNTVNSLATRQIQEVNKLVEECEKTLQLLPNVPGRDEVIKNSIDAFRQNMLRAELQNVPVGEEAFAPLRFAEVWVETYQAAQKEGSKGNVEQLNKINSPTEANIAALRKMSAAYGIVWDREARRKSEASQEDVKKLIQDLNR